MAAKFPLRLSLPDQQLVIMSYADEYAVGNMMLIGDYAIKIIAPSKTYAPVAFGFRRFTAGRTSLTMHPKDFLSMKFAFKETRHFLWSVKKTKNGSDGLQGFNSLFSS